MNPWTYQQLLDFIVANLTAEQLQLPAAVAVPGLDATLTVQDFDLSAPEKPRMVVEAPPA